MIFRFTLIVTAFAQFLSFYSKAQAPPPDWFLRDPVFDHVLGMSVEKAYDSLLNGQPSRTVIVAVIDSGIDIDHEDLKSVIWINEDEVPGNGIDDDHNGYIDDIHGWNFIGGKESNVDQDTYEITREYVRLKKKFGDLNGRKLSKSEKKEYAQYQEIKDKFEKRKAKEVKQYDQIKQQYRLYSNINKNVKSSLDTLKIILHKDKISGPDLEQFHTEEPSLLFAKGIVLRMLKATKHNDTDSLLMELKETVEYFDTGLNQYSTIVDYGYNEDFDSRLIVGDDYNNVHEKTYGNADVKGPDAEHGTHVAGVIGADRKNDIGIKGIADNVRIMVLRAVPNGDERDKDIANSIRYAVDNGAKIINMSFGKSFSPEKGVVDEAVIYAEKKGVLMVHASGNESVNTDKDVHYPSRYFQNGTEAKSWLDVGASGWGRDQKLAASFSNFGKKSVDFFAPGVEIFSTVPGSKYKSLDGTSFACPATAGVAAILMSYFPSLTATEVADILRKSTRKFDGLKVDQPGGGQAFFSDLSITGGLVNAYDAVNLARSIKKSQPEKK